MFTSVKYVLTENFQNLYRIYCIAKYELLADMRDSKFGIFWNFASPAIQVLTYWLEQETNWRGGIPSLAGSGICGMVVFAALYSEWLQCSVFENQCNY